jgi:anti-anti-sigma regulatory factor
MRIDVDLALNSPKPYSTPLRPSKSVGKADPVVVVHLSGALVQGSGVYFFLEQVRLLIGRGIRNIVIDLLNAEVIDNRGVGGLAAAYNAIRDARGKIKYVLDSDDLFSAIRKNHLDRVFEIYKDETSALASF